MVSEFGAGFAEQFLILSEIPLWRICCETQALANLQTLIQPLQQFSTHRHTGFRGIGVEKRP